jgi:hypothetical protein
MTELSLKLRLAKWFASNPGWHASGNVQRMVMAKTSYTPANVSRRLRELENEGELEVRYEKNHAHYRCQATVDPLERFDALASHTGEPPEQALQPSQAPSGR